MNNFNGQGKPLDDNRLTKSGTTNAGYQQYRIWRDSQQVLIPKGQSVTKPLMSENVSMNTGVFGDVSKGYFRMPIVEFRNTVDYKLFDRFRLQLWRSELPTDTPEVDYNNDLKLQAIKVRYHAIFTNPETNIDGEDSGVTWFNLDKDVNWYSEKLHFTDYNNKHLDGDFILTCNPTIPQLEKWQDFISGENLQKINLEISVLVANTFIINGNSKMRLQTKNSIFPVTLKSLTIELIGGE